jgi:Silencing defective 2 N-terminal ubiquitin domain
MQEIIWKLHGFYYISRPLGHRWRSFLDYATMPVTVLVSAFAPFGNFCINVDADSTISDLFEDLTLREPLLGKVGGLKLCPTSRPLAQPSTSLSEICRDDQNLVSFTLTPSLLGGKGGFGSQLRAAGGRMSSQRTSNNDSCRDLSGRRLSTVKEAKKYVHTPLRHISKPDQV